MEAITNNVTSVISRGVYPELASGHVGPDKKTVQQKTDRAEQPETVQPDPERVKAAIEQINDHLALHAVRFEYSVHEKTNAIIVKVVDELTGELIREVPPKKVLDIVAMTWEEMGFLIDEKV